MNADIQRILELQNDPEFNARLDVQLKHDRKEFWKKETPYIFAAGVLVWVLGVCVIHYQFGEPMTGRVLAVASIMPILGTSQFMWMLYPKK